jgi:hypothetical protein
VAVPYPGIDSGSVAVDLHSGHFTMRILGPNGSPYLEAEAGNLGQGFPSVNGDSVIYNRTNNSAVGEVRITTDETVVMDMVAAGQVAEAVFVP